MSITPYDIVEQVLIDHHIPPVEEVDDALIRAAYNKLREKAGKKHLIISDDRCLRTRELYRDVYSDISRGFLARKPMPLMQQGDTVWVVTSDYVYRGTYVDEKTSIEIQVDYLLRGRVMRFDVERNNEISSIRYDCVCATREDAARRFCRLNGIYLNQLT